MSGLEFVKTHHCAVSGVFEDLNFRRLRPKLKFSWLCNHITIGKLRHLTIRKVPIGQLRGCVFFRTDGGPKVPIRENFDVSQILGSFHLPYSHERMEGNPFFFLCSIYIYLRISRNREIIHIPF